MSCDGFGKLVFIVHAKSLYMQKKQKTKNKNKLYFRVWNVKDLTCWTPLQLAAALWSRFFYQMCFALFER